VFEVFAFIGAPAFLAIGLFVLIRRIATGKPVKFLITGA